MIFMRAAIALFGSPFALHRMIREPLEPIEAIARAQAIRPAAAQTSLVPVPPSVGGFHRAISVPKVARTAARLMSDIFGTRH